MKSKHVIYRILIGHGERRSNFHDLRGNRVGIEGLLYFPHVILTTFLRKFFGYYLELPWISYRAQRKIARLIQPDWTILEFGSGMSTLWLARRCKSLFSVEHNPQWYQTVQARLAHKKIGNAHCMLRDLETYADLSAFQEGSFDFVLVDGNQRAACMQAVIPKLKPKGWVYLDNTDMKAKVTVGSEKSSAEDILLEAARQKNGRVEYFTDFAPMMFVVNQGMLVKL